eukprot:s938_g4.t3
MAFVGAPVPLQQSRGRISGASGPSRCARQKAAFAASAFAVWAARGGVLVSSRSLLAMCACRSDDFPEILRALDESTTALQAAAALQRLRKGLPRVHQAQRQLVEVLAELVARVKLDLSTLVSALVVAANAHAFARSAAPSKLLDRFQESVDRCFFDGGPQWLPPEELSYALWALVKLGDGGSPVLQRLLQGCPRAMPLFRAAQISRLAWSLATAELQDAPLLACLGQQATQRAQELHPQRGLAMMAWAFAKLQHYDEDLNRAINIQTERTIAFFKVNELSSIAWAFATVRAANVGPALDSVAEKAIPVMKSFRDNELAMLLWSYAKLETSHPRLLEAGTHEARRRLRRGELSLQHMVNVAYACASLTVEPELVARIADEAAARPEALKAEELASLTWAVATASVSSRLRHSLSTLAAEAAEVHNAGAQELANTLWSLASMLVRDAEVLAGFGDKVLVNISEFKCLDVVNSAWAFATLREVDGRLFRALEERCLNGGGCLLVDATPQQLANLTWAFATVGRGSEGELFEIVAREARAKLGDFSMQGIANLVWAFATAGVDATELFQAVGDKLLSDGGRLSDRTIPDAQIAFAVDLTAVLQNFRARGFTHPVMHWAQTEGLRQLGQHLDLTIIGSLSSPPRSLGTLPNSPDFVFDDEDRCVVLKPPGWQVDTEGDEEDFIEEAHSAREMLSGFMISTFSSTQFPILTDRRCKNGFLHRLDVPSSGLILAAKTYDAYFDLLGQLACGNISRDYVVMLHGFLAASRGIFQFSLDKDVDATWSAKSAVRESGGKASSTRLRVGGYVFAQQHQPLTIVAMRIDSGRRHQIRVQSAYTGHPTVTDRRYTVELVYDADARWCKRNFLHRFSLAFCDSEGAQQSARAALPTDLREAMWEVTPKDMVSAFAIDTWTVDDGVDLPPWDQSPTLSKDVSCSRHKPSMSACSSARILSRFQNSVFWRSTAQWQENLLFWHGASTVSQKACGAALGLVF